MTFYTDIKPSFNRLTALSNSDDFIQSFCQKTFAILNEFEEKFFSALEQQNHDDLHDITHKISSTLQWLELDGFDLLIKSYKKRILSDPKVRQKLAEDIYFHLELIRTSLSEKVCDDCEK